MTDVLAFKMLRTCRLNLRPKEDMERDGLV